MAEQNRILFITLCTFLLLIILVHSQAYPFLNDLPALERSHKFHSQHDVDRYLNRMKQYYATMAQLRLWRRDVNLFDDDDSGDGDQDFLDDDELFLKKRR